MNKRMSLAAAALVLAVPALAACGFNQQTDQIYTPGRGVNDRSGSVDVLHAVLVSGDDGSGTVVAALVNNDRGEGDKLTGITGAGDDEDVEVTIDGTVDIEPDALVQLADDGAVTIEGESVAAGAFVNLTFAFERGASVTMEVPVVSNTDEFSEVPLPSTS